MKLYTKARRAWRIISSGYSLSDKLLLFLFYFLYPFPKRKRYKLLWKDIFIRTKYNCIFRCKKGTEEFFTVSDVEEENLTKLFKLRKGVFLDVGAHIGKYTVLLSKQLNDKGKVIAFEPNPDTFLRLKFNVEFNKCKNVILIPHAAGDKESEVSIWLDEPIFPTHASIVIKSGKFLGKVKMETVDGVLRRYKIKPHDVKLVKIDVEGAELLVLKGMRNLLKRGSPTIIFEAFIGESPTQCKRFLKKYGYKVVKLDERNFLARKP